jgi:hypothetical protein
VIDMILNNDDRKTLAGLLRKRIESQPLTKASIHGNTFALSLVEYVIEPFLTEYVDNHAEVLDARAEVEELDELIADKQALLRTIQIMVAEG